MYLLISIAPTGDAQVMHQFNDENAARSALARCEEKFVGFRFDVRKVEGMTIDNTGVKINLS